MLSRTITITDINQFQKLFMAQYGKSQIRSSDDTHRIEATKEIDSGNTREKIVITTYESGDSLCTSYLSHKKLNITCGSFAIRKYNTSDDFDPSNYPVVHFESADKDKLLVLFPKQQHIDVDGKRIPVEFNDSTDINDFTPYIKERCGDEGLRDFTQCLKILQTAENWLRKHKSNKT